MIFFDHKSQSLIYSGFLKYFDILLCPNIVFLSSRMQMSVIHSKIKYQIEIKESLQRVTTVSAASESEAVELVRQYYKEERIILDAGCFTSVDFSIRGCKPRPYYKSPNNDFILAQGDCFKLLKEFDFKFDMIFADPPYFLSNGGISLQSGNVVCVDKGEWDKGKSQEDMMAFNMEWLRLCRDKLKDNGTIWISGTYHNIFSVANCLTELGYKILNVITWEKTNPPVNISCRYFKYSTEFVIWARKMRKVPHKFNYELMKELNGGKQMSDVWRMPAIGRWEKTCGKHPTQKPLRLLVRMILASTNQGDWILDPFSGSSTTGIAANLCGRRFAGLEQEEEFCKLSKARREEIENLEDYDNLINHIEDLHIFRKNFMVKEDANVYAQIPF